MPLTLDSRTQTIVQVAVSTVLLVVMLIAWRTEKTYPGFGRWTISKIPAAVGFLLVSLRGFIPDELSFLVANALLMSTIILLYEGIRQFRDKPHISVLHYLLLICLVPAFAYFYYIHPSLGARLVILGFFLCIIVFRSAWNLFFQVPRELRPSFWFTGSMFALYGVVLLLRIVTAGSVGSVNDPFATDAWTSLALTATLIMPIGWTFGFFMMTNDRLTLELRTAERGLRAMVATDYLTGVMSRRAFVEQCEREAARARRDDEPLALLIIDIDEFKQFNDSYGHLAGDELLRAMVAACRANLRTVDLLARWGGEEFAVLLPDTAHDDCVQIAERLRSAVAEVSVPVGEQQARVTISIGGALWTLDDADLDNVLRRADIALYQAKERGRDCVVVGTAVMQTAVPSL